VQLEYLLGDIFIKTMSGLREPRATANQYVLSHLDGFCPAWTENHELESVPLRSLELENAVD